METQVTEVQTTKLDEIVTQSGLQINDAEAIKQSYLPYFTQIAEIKELAKKIDFENPSEIDEKIARDLRLRTVKVRTGSQSVKEERKRIHQLKANVEQSAWNLIKTTCELDEEVFLQVEKRREIAEAKRVSELKVEREKELEPYLEFVSLNFINIGQMPNEDYEKLLSGAKLQLQAKQEAAAKAELARIEKEKLEAEEREKIKIENEKLKKEAEEKAKQLEQERRKAELERKEAEAKLKAEQAKAESERKVIEEKAQKEREEAELQAKKLKEMADAKLKEEKEKSDKLAAELKAKVEEEAAKLKAEEDAMEAALNATDKQKLIEVGKYFAALTEPLLTSKKAIAIFAQFKQHHEANLNFLRTKLKSLK